MLVSAVMITRGRREMAGHALSCFFAQTYPDKELVIIDDADNPSFPDGVRATGVNYVLNHAKLCIPAKRNQSCEMARGEIIWTLDSDDWSAPERMADQVARLEESGKAMTGYHAMLFACDDGRVYRYAGKPGYAIGTSHCYLRSWWQSHRWHEQKTINSDNLFSKAANGASQLITVDAGQMQVARIHSGNTSGKPTTSPPYRRVDRSELPAGFLDLVTA